MPSSRKFEYEKRHCPAHMLSGVLMYRQRLLSLESGGSGDHGVPKMGPARLPNGRDGSFGFEEGSF